MIEHQQSPRPAVALVLALVVVASAHLDSLGGGFVWDDHALIERQADVHEVRPLASYFFRMFWSDPLALGTRAFYRPLVSLSFSLDWVRGDGTPHAFHVTNLVAHLGCVALLFVWLRRRKVPVVAGAIATVLWGTFPRLTESTAWISGRTDVFAAFFGLGALVLWPTGSSRSSLRRGFAALCLLAGLFSKEVAVAFGLALLATEGFEARKSGAGVRRVLRRTWPLALSFAVYAVARALTPTQPAVTPTLGGGRLVTALEALGDYVVMVLTPLWPQTQVGLLGVPDLWRVGLGAMVLVGAPLALWRVREHWTPEPAAATLLLVSLGLVLQLIPLALNVVAADRFLYVPLLGLVALAAPLLQSRRAVTIAVALGVAFVHFTRVRIDDWADDLHLWRQALAHRHPLSSYPIGAWADALLEHNFDVEAVRAYEFSFEVQRRHEQATGESKSPSETGRLNLAVAFQRLGHFPEADRVLAELEREHPEWRRAHLARVVLELRRFDLEAARQALGTFRRVGGPDAEARDVERLMFEVARQRNELEGAPDTLDTAFARARLFAEVGARHEMSTSFLALLTRPDCDAQHALQALGALTFDAPVELAVEALGRVTARFPDLDVAALRDIITARHDEWLWVREVEL